ncbi:MAG: DUF2269 domain-containing protein [Kordiimonadaceae bacterium]|nr:DUF2269 domain-containing protein [Kordiimonadaceae bacterium]MBO6567126.1 DUF2269 domain-containing protein [Kordiimonadaceae bacterium]MBO6963659.1 DUF2269 domain-containing protein [Kordiimonadaceae bacterium]
MDWFAIIKTLHVISATILFGTGLGIAFFMFRSLFTDDIHEKLYAARNTVLADYIFTFPAALIQPLSGLWLINAAGYSWNELWLLTTYGLYLLAAVCWLPVVWIQIQLKTMLIAAAETGSSLPERYNRLFRIWFALGWPAFVGLVVIFFLMVTKPT